MGDGPGVAGLPGGQDGGQGLHRSSGARWTFVVSPPRYRPVAGLVADEKALAIPRILEGAGVPSATVQANPSPGRPLARFDAKLDSGT